MSPYSGQYTISGGSGRMTGAAPTTRFRDLPGRGILAGLLGGILLLGALLPPGAAASLPDSIIGEEEFARRRQALAKRLERGVLVLQDEEISRRTVEDVDGNTPKYDFWYLTGWEKAGSILLLRADTGEAALFVPGKKRQAREAAKRTGMEKVLPTRAFPKTLKEWLGEVSSPIWTKLTPRGRPDGWVRLLEGLAPVGQMREVGDHLVQSRLVKSEAEIEVMRKVAEIGARGLRKVIGKIRPGMREGDVARAIEKAYGKAGAQRVSFPSIVGSGMNGTVIHYTKNASTMKSGEVAVIEVGAELDHYASDISRTIPVSGRFTPRQREVYQAVLDAQAAGEGVLKPGATLQDIHQAADAVLRGRGFPSIPHFVGHFVGLSVHDSGTRSTPLEAGMVVTIEPGVYLRGEGIGVRIEDMYLVTDSGFERLSGAVPRTVEEVETLRGGTPSRSRKGLYRPLRLHGRASDSLGP